MRRFVILPMLLLATSAVAAGQTLTPKSDRAGKVEEEVMRAERERLRALTGGDLKALAPLLADDLTYTHSNGAVDTKAKFLGALESGDVKYEALNHTDVEARAYQNAAVMTGRSAVKLRARGQEMRFTIRFTSVYVKQNGRWQLAAWQSTRLPQS